MSAHHEEHAHRPVWHYVLIAVFLGLLTLIELGPLFQWFNLPIEVLLVLSAVKFTVVVALFMHLWDDASVFSQIFSAPLLGAIAMVVVLMSLASSFFPSPRNDSAPIIERYWTNYSGECSSWVRSHVSNRWYCTSPPIDRERLAVYNAPAGGGAGSGPAIDTSSKESLAEAGKALYEANCVACHQVTGQGIPGAFPPIAGSDYEGYLDPQSHARIIVKGLTGEITVKGTTYNGAMTPFGAMLSDAEIAAIATYERNAWGNDHGMVTPEQVAKAR
ncbi:MAG: c-type cytochrome [Alphaproteobacteria bacterium]|nr:c-type cytochrome [Alphaproteobacteria bacterium]